MSDLLHGAALICDGSPQKEILVTERRLTCVQRAGASWRAACPSAKTLIELGKRSEAGTKLRESISEFHTGRMVQIGSHLENEIDQEVQAQALLAESLLLEGNHTAALKTLTTVLFRIAKVEDISARKATTITAGAVRGQFGDRASAHALLASAEAGATKRGYRLHEVEAKLALANLDNNRASRAARINVIQQQAKAAGFGLIARKATAYSQ